MPIEIKELVIRAVADTGNEEMPPRDAPPAPSADDQNALIETCVKEVLRILNRSKER